MSSARWWPFLSASMCQDVWCVAAIRRVIVHNFSYINTDIHNKFLEIDAMIKCCVFLIHYLTADDNSLTWCGMKEIPENVSLLLEDDSIYITLIVLFAQTTHTLSIRDHLFLINQCMEEYLSLLKSTTYMLDPCARVYAPPPPPARKQNRTGVTRLSTCTKRGGIWTDAWVCLHYWVVTCDAG